MGRTDESPNEQNDGIWFEPPPGLTRQVIWGEPEPAAPAPPPVAPAPVASPAPPPDPTPPQQARDVHWTEVEPLPPPAPAPASARADEDPWLQEDRMHADSRWDDAGSPGPQNPPAQVFPLEESFAFGAGSGGSFGSRGLSRSLLVIGLVMLLVAGALVFWFSRAGGGGVALAIEQRPATATAYVMALKVQGTVSANGSSESVSGSVNAHLAWKVLSVDSDGVADVQLTLSKISAESGGKGSKVKGPVKVTVKIAPDGRMLSGTDLSFLGDGTGGLPGTSQFVPVLPDHPVKPGDTWSMGYQQTNPLGYGTLDVSATGRLVSIQSEGGRKVATVETKETVPLHVTLDLAQLASAYGQAGVPKGAKIIYSGQVDVTQFSWIDTAAKQLLRSTTDASFHIGMTFDGLGSGLPNGETVTFDGSMSLGLNQAHPPAGLSL